MANVEVQKFNGDKSRFPIFAELAKRFDSVRRRAFELFETRGRGDGNDLEDWLKAEREMLGSCPSELKDTGNAFETQIALPGFDAKDVQVTASEDELIVRAGSKKETKSESDNVLWTEFSSCDIYRRIPLPSSVDAEKTTASLENGILQITAPKVAE